MFKHFTRTLMLLTVTFMLAVLTLPAAPPAGKGGGKGSGGDGGTTAPFSVTALYMPTSIYVPTGLSDPNLIDKCVYIVGDVHFDNAMLSKVDTLGNVLQTTALSFNAQDVTSDGFVATGLSTKAVHSYPIRAGRLQTPPGSFCLIHPLKLFPVSTTTTDVISRRGRVLSPRGSNPNDRSASSIDE